MSIGKRYTFHSLLFATAAITLLAGAGCKKENGIQNNNVVRTPYGLYTGQVNGKVENTNDGATYDIVFGVDNSLPRTILTSGLNILMVKYNLQLGHGGQDLFLLQTDNAKPNFNYVSTVHLKPTANWASMILDVPSHDAVYAATVENNGASVSYDHGLVWTDAKDGTNSADISKVTSFTQTRDGNLYALDNTTPNIFTRTGKKLAWTLPQQSTTGLPTGDYYLSHINNTLLAGDHTGGGGVYYSADKGINWTQYPFAMNTGQQILSLAAPFDQVVIAGMDSAGIYRLVNGTFVASNNGLEPFTSVWGIVGKENVFKNDVIKQYIYIATNKGLFRSEDLGQNWTKLRGEDFRVIY